MSCQQKHYSSVLALICFSLRQFSELVLRNTYISLLQLMLSPQAKNFGTRWTNGLLRCTMTNSDLLNCMKTEKCYDLRQLT